MKSEKTRCWKTTNPLYIRYHDEEWGVPVHNDNKLFEFLALEGFQAGLRWELILKKRDTFRKAFDNFDPTIISGYDKEKVEKLMDNSGIIRNKLKILAVIHNAQLVINIQRDYGSLDAYLWQFTMGKNLMTSCNSFLQLPSESKESQNMSRQLKKKGFKFVGPTICYAFMQAVGMVNDHITECFRHDQIKQLNNP